MCKCKKKMRKVAKNVVDPNAGFYDEERDEEILLSKQ